MKLPIFNNRAIVGYASSESQAIKILQRTITVSEGLNLKVWRRSADMQSILQLPDGYVYSVHYKY